MVRLEFETAWERAHAEKPFLEMATNATSADREAAANTLVRLAVFAGDQAENHQDFSPQVIRTYAEGYPDEEHIIFAAYNLAGLTKDKPRPPVHQYDDIEYARSLYVYHPGLYPNIKKPFPIEHPLIKGEINDVIALTGAGLGSEEKYPLIGLRAFGLQKTGTSSFGHDIKVRKIPDVKVAVLAIAPTLAR